MFNPPPPPSEERPHGHAAMESGFTLLEIMVALAILGGVIVTALASISYHLSVMDNNVDSTLAAMLARERLTQMRVLGEEAKTKGRFDAPYEDFSWTYRRETSEYQGVWNESIGVKRDGAVSTVTITTMTPEEKK